MGCNTSTEQVLGANANGIENLDNENNLSLQKNKKNAKSLDNNENQKISKNDNDLEIEDYGTEEEEAAVKIQAAFRGHKTRNQLKQQTKEISNNNKENNENNLDDPELEKAATKIQAFYRGHRTRAELKKADTIRPIETKTDAEELEQQAAVKIQAVFRGHKTRATMKNNSDSSNTQSKASGNAAISSPTSETEPTKEELEQEFDPNDKELCNAASKIQATFRGHLARKIQTENGKLKEEDVDIQELTKKVAEELDIDLSDPDLHAAATKIQASFRGHKVRKTDEEKK